MAGNSPGAAVDEAVGLESGSVHVRTACVPSAVAVVYSEAWKLDMDLGRTARLCAHLSARE